MSRLVELQAASTLSDLAHILRLKPTFLAFVLHGIKPEDKYTTFEAPKRSGGMRLISAPVPRLKLVQRRLSTLLQDCWDSINQAHGRKDGIAHGFKRRHSIISNAREHRNRNYVFNVDLKDFFPSLNFGRVRGYFINDSSFQLKPAVATVIAQIACHDNSLPQGSPCSPVISNLIGHVLDIKLVALAARHGCTYSRYADDLTFSTNKKNFPSGIAKSRSTDVHQWGVGKTLKAIVKQSGFKLNPTKTRMQYHDSRQEVTGLVVNRRVNVRREYRNLARAMVHNLLRDGSFEVRDPTGALQPGRLEQLQGMLNFIDSVDLHARYIAFANSNQHDALWKPIKEFTVAEFGTVTSRFIGPLSAGERLFQRFLLYKEFYATEKPVIVCEGDTDNVYLLHAIHSLAQKFPELASVPKTKAVQLKLRLFKYFKSRTARLLGLGDGGGSVLAALMRIYLGESSEFRAPAPKHPIIILVDQDSGGKAVLQDAEKHYKKAFQPGISHMHIHANLYVMRVPLLAGKTDTAIEDLFDDATRNIKINGKLFNTEKNADPNLFFGKTVFAHKVVRPNAKSIDFSGFAPLLETIVLIQQHYAKVAASAENSSS